MDVGHAFSTLFIALGVGLLVGIQRERVEAPHAGVRTFGLITLLGALAGLLQPVFGSWLLVAGLLSVALVTLAGNVAHARAPLGDGGITTEVAILLMYVIGAALAVSPWPVGVALGAGVAVLLYAKPVLRGFVKRLGDTEMRVLMQFVLISLVILPVLPDRAYGPFLVLNPREIWWMVVLVVSIGLGGWLALKLYGQQTGVLLAGLLGGLVSSTATTVSFARRVGTSPAQHRAVAIVILLSSTVVYARVLVELVAAAPRLFPQIAPPIAVMLGASALLCLAVWRGEGREQVELPARENPAELRPALVFGALYGLVVLLVAAARHHLGDRGVFAAAFLSGLTDLDAITLGSARMAERGVLATSTVWRAVVVALLSNLGFKAVMVFALAGPALGRRVTLLFSVMAAVGLALLFTWPG